MKGSFDNIISIEVSNIEIENTGNDYAELDFEKCFKDNYSNLCSYAFSFVYDKDAAEDIVQEVFFNIWKITSPRKYSEIKKSYLYKSVKNYSLNYIKHEKVIARHIEQKYVENRINEITPENESVAGELSIEIEKAIEQLPGRQREVFVLSRKNELSYKEISEIMKISIKTVEAQMGSALKFLRSRLSRFFLLF